jgi:drug/metabolite transporter (DMT)-like permease
MLATAVAVVMIKPMLGRLPLLWVLEIRLAAGVAALLLYLALHPRRRQIARSLVSGGVRWEVVVSSLLGGYLAVMAWLGAFKLAQASVAAALNQTNTIFVLLLAALFLRERITPLRALAVASAVAGALLVIFGQG